MLNKLEYVEAVVSVMERTCSEPMKLVSVEGDEHLYCTSLLLGSRRTKKELYVSVNGVQRTLDWKLIILPKVESTISPGKLYAFLNELERQYSYLRVYVQNDGQLIAGYRALIEAGDSSDGKILFMRNLKRIISIFRTVATMSCEEMDEFLQQQKQKEKKRQDSWIEKLFDEDFSEELELDPFH